MREPFPLQIPSYPLFAWKYILGAACLCLLLVAAWLAAGASLSLWRYATGRTVIVAMPPSSPAQEIIDARNAGQYARALQTANEMLRRHPDLPDVRRAADEMQADFSPSFNLHCIPKGIRRNQAPVENCQLLRPQDEFYLKVDLTSLKPRGYAWMFLADSAGDWKTLLPNAQDFNPLVAANYRVPNAAEFREGFHPSPVAGQESVFLVMAWWDIPELDELSRKLSAESEESKRRDIGLQISTRLQVERNKPAALRGLKIGTLQFETAGQR